MNTPESYGKKDCHEDTKTQRFTKVCKRGRCLFATWSLGALMAGKIMIGFDSNIKVQNSQTCRRMRRLLPGTMNGFEISPGTSPYAPYLVCFLSFNSKLKQQISKVKYESVKAIEKRIATKTRRHKGSQRVAKGACVFVQPGVLVPQWQEK